MKDPGNRTMKILINFCLFLSLSFQISANSPNILFILADDMGVDAIKGFGIGEDHPTTPNLDKLRSQGLTFTNVWATPVCSATRASLLTGKYGVNNGVNTIPGYLGTEHKSIFIEMDEQSNGKYSNCLLGKWHLAKNNNYNHLFDHGVEEFMGVINAGVEDYFAWTKYENGEVNTSTSYATQYFTDYAIDWIKEQEQPWFLWLAHVAPHAPLHVPPEGTYTISDTGNKKRKYKAMIESLDHEIGRLINGMEEEVLENTLIIFLGDNGTPGNLISGFPENRGKQSIYQGGISVPLIISGKGVNRTNEVENALINVSDFYVTLSQIVNPEAYPTDHVFDSYSFKHLLSGDEGNNRVYNYMELGANENVPDSMYTVRNEQFKLLDLGNGNLEFYDLLVDTFELNNLLLQPLTPMQIEAKEYLLELLAEIRGINPSNDPPTGQPGKYPVIHTGLSSFYGINTEMDEPGSGENLFWQDAGRIENPASYVDNGDNTITDQVSGLMWQKDMGEKITFADALEKADNLSLGGYDDWRIPSIKELYSLIDFTGRVQGQMAVDLFINTDYFDQPLGDVSAGEREIDAQTWSSTHYTGLTMNGDSTLFGVNFVDGRIKGYPKYKPQNGEANKMYFRMVRGNLDYGFNLFYDNNNGTVTDSATMLMWQKTDDGVARDWLSSIAYCEGLELGGFDDWHLPHAKELQSIVDYSRSPDASHSAAIDSIFNVSEIEDPDGNPGHYPYYWTTTSHLDGPNPYSSAVYIAFGKALGKMNGNLLDVHGAGSQRSDPKTGQAADYPKYHGPQGDVQIVFNHCRCVRKLEDQSTKSTAFMPGEIILYPNPFDDKLRIEWLGEKQNDFSVKIYSLDGKLLYRKAHNSSENEIDLSALANGIFHLLIQADSTGTIIKKIIKL